MKTFVIFNTFENLDYFIIKGNYKHLNGIYINSTTDEEGNTKQDELDRLLFDKEGGLIQVKFKLEYWANELRTTSSKWTIIECGLIP